MTVRSKATEKAQSESQSSSARVGRFEVVLPQESLDRLDLIKGQTGAASAAEVFRRSLRLYEALLAEKGDDGVLIVRRKNGEEITVPLSLLVL